MVCCTFFFSSVIDTHFIFGPWHFNDDSTEKNIEEKHHIVQETIIKQPPGLSTYIYKFEG